MSALDDFKKRRENASATELDAFRERRSRAKIKYDVDDKYVTDFSNDVSSFFNDIQSSYNKLTYGASKDALQGYTDRWTDLNNRAKYLNAYINSNRDKLGEQTYKDMSSYLRSFDTGSRDYLKGFEEATDYYAQFKDQKEYDAYINSDYYKNQSLLKDIKNASNYLENSENKVTGYGIEDYSKDTPEVDSLGVYLRMKELGMTGSKYNPTMNNYGKDVYSQSYGKAEQNNWNQLTDEEIKAYYYIYNTKGLSEAKSYLNGLNNILGQRKVSGIVDVYNDANVLEKIAMNIATIPATVIGGLPAFGEATNALIGKEVNPYSPSMGLLNLSEAIRGQTATDINNAFGNMQSPLLGYSFGEAYQAVMSGLDSAMGVATMGPAYTALMGTSAFASTANKLQQSGGNPVQVSIGATCAAIAEIFFENFSVENLISMKNDGTFKTALVNIAKQAGIEFSEEFATEFANIVSESLVMQDKSDFMGNVGDGGVLYAIGQSAAQMFTAGISGALSGGLSAGAHQIGNAALGNLNAWSNYSSPEAQKGLVESGLESAKGTMSNTLAERGQSILDSGKNLKPWQTRRLIEANERAFADENNASMSSKIEQRLKYLGETTDTKKLADAIAKSLTDEDLSLSEKKTLKNGRFTDRILSELNNTNNKSYDAEWTKDAEVKNEEAKTDNINTEATKPTVTEPALPTEKVVSENEPADTEVDEKSKLHELVSKLGLDTKTSNAIEVAYKPEYGSVHDYILGMQEGYNFGHTNQEFGHPNTTAEHFSLLPESLQKLAYSFGEQARKTEAESLDKSIKSNANGKTGRRKGTVKGKVGILQHLEKQLGANKREIYGLLSYIAEVTGIDIELVNSAPINGEYTDWQGNYRATKEPFKIYLDIHSGLADIHDVKEFTRYTLMRTFSHEFVHFCERWNPLVYDEFRGLVFKHMNNKGINVHDLIEENMIGDKISYDDASRDVVAEGMTEVLPEASFIEELATKHRNIFEQLFAKLKEFFEKLKAEFKSLANNPSSRNVNALREEKDGILSYIQEILDKFNEMAYGAVENFQSNFAVDEETGKLTVEATPVIEESETADTPEVNYSKELLENAKKILNEKGTTNFRLAIEDVEHTASENEKEAIQYAKDNGFKLSINPLALASSTLQIDITDNNGNPSDFMIIHDDSDWDRVISKIKREVDYENSKKNVADAVNENIPPIKSAMPTEIHEEAETKLPEVSEVNAEDPHAINEIALKIMKAIKKQGTPYGIKTSNGNYFVGSGAILARVDKATFDAVDKEYYLRIIENNTNIEQAKDVCTNKIEGNVYTTRLENGGYEVIVYGEGKDQIILNKKYAKFFDGYGFYYSDASNKKAPLAIKNDNGELVGIILGIQSKVPLPTEKLELAKFKSFSNKPAKAPTTQKLSAKNPTPKSAPQSETKTETIDQSDYAKYNNEELNRRVKFDPSVPVTEAELERIRKALVVLDKDIDYFLNERVDKRGFSNKKTVAEVVEHLKKGYDGSGAGSAGMRMSYMGSGKGITFHNSFVYGTQGGLLMTVYGAERLVTWNNLAKRMLELMKEDRANGKNVDSEGRVSVNESNGEGASRLLDELQTSDVQGTSSAGDTSGSVEERRSETGRDSDVEHEGHRDSRSDGTGESGDLRRTDGLTETVNEEIEQKSTETPRGNNFVIDESLNLPSGEKARFRANVDAIKLVKNLLAEGRYATPSEQEVLSKYVGWGGLSNAFGELKYNRETNKSEMTPKSGWEAEFAEFRKLVDDGIITEEEYKEASASTKNAHYTSIEVIKAMYDGLAQMGFNGGRMLEPSCGVGNFVGGMPVEMSKNVKSWTMVELDSITGLIAKYLYPNADIRIQGFENANIPDNYMDVAIGNVPFGNYGVVDRAYPKRVTKSIHNYFFAKSLDKVHTGGIIMFITSSFTMNGDDTGLRHYIMDRADLVGAIRLPNNAFSGNAGTEVVTDIIVLKKREQGTPYAGESFLEAPYTDLGEGYYRSAHINEYFNNHPEMVLGTPAFERGMYGANTLTYNPIEGKKLGDQIREAFKNINAKIDYPAKPTPEMVNAEVKKANSKTKNNGYVVNADGTISQNDNGVLVKRDIDTATAKRIAGMLKIRDAYKQLVSDLQEGKNADVIAKSRKALNTVYDSFVKEHGYINSPKNKSAIEGDPDSYSILSLENFDSKKKTASKADIFTKDTIRPNRTITHVDTIESGVIVSINTTGGVDASLIANLLGKNEAEVTRELIDNRLAFKRRDGSLEAPSTYLSGNVRAKLREAEALAPIDKDFENNVEELQRIIPKDISFSDIYVTPGTPWIPTDVYADFIAEMLGGRNNPNAYYGPDVEVGRSVTGEYKITINNSRLKSRFQNTQQWGTKRRTFIDLIDAIMGSRSVTVKDYYEDENGRKVGVVNEVETSAAQEKVEEIIKEFQNWLWKDESRRDSLAKLYNETFNALVTPKFDGSNLTINGLNANFSLRKHQANAVQRIISSGGNTLLAHKVGAGKHLKWQVRL